MALRKASSYTKMKVVPYTRTSKKKRLAYIKTVPPQNIVKFTMGNSSAYNEGKFSYVLTVVAEQAGQIRHNALEACRQYVNHELEAKFPNQYVFKVLTYPHHIQRENKMLTGAGSDRMQTGMQLSFGKAMGKAALVKPGTKVFLVAASNQKIITVAREMFRKVKSKLPLKMKMVSEEPKAH
ncbi:MAG: 50S ribosomal protein L16 [Candidatus Pacearchaeota archaeon]